MDQQIILALNYLVEFYLGLIVLGAVYRLATNGFHTRLLWFRLALVIVIFELLTHCHISVNGYSLTIPILLVLMVASMIYGTGQLIYIFAPDLFEDYEHEHHDPYRA